MSEYRDEAIKTLQREDAAAKYDRYGQARRGEDDDTLPPA